MTVSGAIAVRPFAYHERLPSVRLEWVETGGIHKLNRAREGCVYVKVGIAVAVTKGVFVTEASAEARGIQTRGSASVREASARGAEILFVRALGASPFIIRKILICR